MRIVIYAIFPAVISTEVRPRRTKWRNLTLCHKEKCEIPRLLLVCGLGSARDDEKGEPYIAYDPKFTQSN